MNRSVLLNIGHVIAGITVGLLVHYFSGEHSFTIGLLSIITGLLTIIMLEVIFQPHSSRKEFNNLTLRLDHLNEKMADRLTEATDIASILKFGHVQVSVNKVAEVWLDRIWKTKHRYWGVLYAAPQEVTITTVFNLGLTVMAAKVRVDQVDVKRIFLLETDSDFENSREAMQACSDHGLNVRHLYREQMKRHTLLAGRVANLPTLDFTIYDSNLMWLIRLDKNRHILNGELYFDDKMNDQYAEIFRLMWDAAIPFGR